MKYYLIAFLLSAAGAASFCMVVAIFKERLSVAQEFLYATTAGLAVALAVIFWPLN